MPPRDSIERPWADRDRNMVSADDSTDVVKASFDTDLRFETESRASVSEGQERWLRNPYRLMDPETRKMLDKALPILRSLKSSNPWQQSNNRSSPSSMQGIGITTQVNNQTRARISRSMSHGEEHPEESTSGLTDSTQKWNQQIDSFPGHNYFANLKQREQSRALFGKSGPSLLQTPSHDFAWSNVQNGISNTQHVFNSESAPTFGAVSEQTSLPATKKDKGSPTTPVRRAREMWRNPQFQTVGGYTWRTYTTSDNSRGDQVSSSAAGKEVTFEENNNLEARLPSTNVPAVIKERCSKSPHLSVQAIANKNQVTYPREESHNPDGATMNVVRDNICRNASGTFSVTHLDDDECPLPDVSCMKFQRDQSQAADVHEVDESRLLPDDVNIEKLQYVLFFDISKKSFFEEVQKPFLSGSLLYFFYQDPSMLLPTRGHPFYKENAHNWIYFYPDCGTEYGGYQLAAPAVITWMNEKVPRRVKFLVHGHQKQLKLNNMLRKVIYYPTSRVIDVVLLNRMLNGDFDAQHPGEYRTAATGGTRTVGVQQSMQSAREGKTSTVVSVTRQRVAPASASASARTSSVIQSTRNCLSRDTANAPEKRNIVSLKAPSARKKICWDR
ncbi:uncharacterized protein LOC135385918 isoform X2 [Ornithodoros turicata]